MSSATATHLVTPATVTLTGDGIELAGQEPQTLAHIYNLTGLDYNVLIEAKARCAETIRAHRPALRNKRTTARPKVEVKAARIYSRLGWIMGLTFGILALGGLMLYKRGTV